MVFSCVFPQCLVMTGPDNWKINCFYLTRKKRKEEPWKKLI
jgi:hypothetical protein